MEQTTRMHMRTKDIDTFSPQDAPGSTRLSTFDQGYATSCDWSGSGGHWQFGSISMNLPLQTDVETPPTDVFLPSTPPHIPSQRPDVVTSPPSATSICFGSVQAQHWTPFLREKEAHCEVLDASPLDLSGAKSPISCAPTTARVIEDIDSIMYPDGVRRPSVKLNKYSKQCMSRLGSSDKDHAMGSGQHRGRATAFPPSANVPRQVSADRQTPASQFIAPIAHTLPSALSTSRFIENINSIVYPDGVQRPSVELNKYPKRGKFRYDRDFLLQFMAVCKEKPDSLPPLDAIGLEPSHQYYTTSHIKYVPQGGGPTGPALSAAPYQAVFGHGISGFKQTGSNMGPFATQGGTKIVSEGQFTMSSRPATMSSSPDGLPSGRPGAPPMARPSGQDGPGAVPMGNDHNDLNPAAQADVAIKLIAPVEASAIRWTPANLASNSQAADDDSPVTVDRKVKSLLNKLTMGNFDSISDQIIAWANKSEMEDDGHTLIQVIRLVFEQVIDDAACPVSIYARLCRKMMEQVSPKVQDDDIRSPEGWHITGGHLFRRYLLNRCREDFERSWVTKEAAVAVAAGSALYSDEYYIAQKAKCRALGCVKFIGELFKLQMLTERVTHECVKKLLGYVANPEEAEIESFCKLLTTIGALLDSPRAHAHMDFYFSRMQELTRSPSVNSRIRFMLQEVIELRERGWAPRYPNATLLDDAATKLRIAETRRRMAGLSGGVATRPPTRAGDPSRFGKVEKTGRASIWARMYRGGSRRGAERSDYGQTDPDGWAVAAADTCPPIKAGDLSQFSKIEKTGPTATFVPETISASKKDMPRGDSSRGAERNEHRQIGPDGCQAVAGTAARPPTKAGDLSQFGKIGKTGPPGTFGPASIFGNKKENKRESITRTGSAHMFSMLRQNPELAAGTLNASKSSGPLNIDLGAGGAPDAPLARRKLNLLPRSVPKSDEKAASTPAASTVGSEDEGGDNGTPGMSEAEIKARIDEDSKEFFGIRDLGEAETYFTKLPVKHRHRLVDKLVTSAFESKEADATLVADFFSRAVGKNLCSPATFEEGFMQSAEILDDVTIDAPKAPSLFVKMMRGAGLDKDEARRTRLAGKSMDSDTLLSMPSA